MMAKRVLLVVGIPGALAAAGGLNRFGSFVSAFDGADASFLLSPSVSSVIGVVNCL